ncbi:PAAR domain-containing protein [Caballeronia sp. AZ1_KS37]|jgi:hypothetical protein|uniref:PAAR domain-containing protein n=1 Tax=Caballeronia sp. AZ1_KS37 TaxID=2921756 RepID=UPI00202909B8|nr:PAAR domain-containing protein [Caballeronia sp. AZ1_KS37]
MRKAAVRDDDYTSTGGRVLARSTGTIFDNGKRVALDRSLATCGKCEGRHLIFGTGSDLFDSGTKIVLDGDLVGCPCRVNRVLAGSDAGYYFGAAQCSSKSSDPAQQNLASSTLRDHWISFTLGESNYNGLSCVAHFADGSTEHGTVDMKNVIRFNRSNSSACLQFEFVTRESDTSDRSVTESLLSLICG